MSQQHPSALPVKRTTPWPAWIQTAPPWADCLYRLYGADGGLLYIGLTFQPRARLKKHWRTKPWADQVTSATFEIIPPARPDQISGLHRFEAEEAAIACAVRTQAPLYNIAGVTRPYWVYDCPKGTAGLDEVHQ